MNTRDKSLRVSQSVAVNLLLMFIIMMVVFGLVYLVVYARQQALKGGETHITSQLISVAQSMAI